MPIYLPRKKIKTRCKKCGQVYSYYIGGFEDNLTPWDMKIIRENQESQKCPRCGSTDNKEDKE